MYVEFSSRLSSRRERQKSFFGVIGLWVGRVHIGGGAETIYWTGKRPARSDLWWRLNNRETWSPGRLSPRWKWFYGTWRHRIRDHCSAEYCVGEAYLPVIAWRVRMEVFRSLIVHFMANWWQFLASALVLHWAPAIGWLIRGEILVHRQICGQCRLRELN